MAASGGDKKSSYLLPVLLLMAIFWSAPLLFALPAASPELNGFPGNEYAHHRQGSSPLKPPKAAEENQHGLLQLDVTGARFSCSADDCSHHRGCDLEIEYHLSSDVQQTHDIATEVKCRARLDYTTSHGYRLKSERCSSPAAHILHHHDQINSTIVLEFQFSPYEQVVDAQVGAIHCHIEAAELIKDALPL